MVTLSLGQLGMLFCPSQSCQHCAPHWYLPKAGIYRISSESFNSTVSEWAIRDGFEFAVNWHMPRFSEEQKRIWQHWDLSCGDLIMHFCASQDSEALREGLPRPLAMIAVNCPVFSGIQKSSDNCIVSICFCVQSDVAFIPDALNSSPQGCPGWCSALMPFQGSTLPG